MVKRSHGLRVKTRHVLRKRARERGMPPVSHSLIKFDAGEKASIIIDPSIHHGMPHRRFQGLTGTVVDKQGRCYLVKVKVGNKDKIVLANPEHLRKVRG
ncbi:MAG: 50S ribosomal protein L21e [Candidatus Thermoplasmatota archaeon]|nr:50S ribosomal protein L21e [Candidatus Thermoplasmatota archaeon]